MTAALHVRLLDPSFSVFHYDVELAGALSEQIEDLELWAPTALRDPAYPLPASMPPIKGVSLQRLANSTGHLWGRPVQGYDYFLNELYVATRLLREPQPPIVHIQFLSLFGRSALENRWFTWLKRRASHLVYTVHDVLPPDRHDNVSLLASYGRLYHEVDHLIVHTDHQKEQIVHRFDISNEKVSVVPHGPLFHRLKLPTREQAANRLGIDPARTIILHFGHMRPYKGTEILIEATAKVLADHPDLLLVMAGRATPERGQWLIECISQSGLQEDSHCRFEYLPTDELACYLALSDVIALPYLYIDQSGVLLSALSLGIPVIASDVGGFAETIRNQDIGFLFASGSVEDLAAQLQEVLSHLDMAKSKANRARSYVLSQLSWSVIADRTIALYRSLSNG